MPKLVSRVGTFLDKYVLKDFHLRRKGFLNVLSFTQEGAKHDWECMHRGHAVIMLPVDYERQVVFLIEQPRANFALAEDPSASALVAQTLRYGDVPDEVTVFAEAMHMIDVAAGMIERSDGDDLIRAARKAARRELAEEQGFAIADKDLELVSDHYVSIGGTTERHIAFLVDVTGLTPDPEPKGDGNERIASYEYAFAEARALLASGKVRSGSLAVMLRELFLRLAEEKLRKIAEYDAPYETDG